MRVGVQAALTVYKGSAAIGRNTKGRRGSRSAEIDAVRIPGIDCESDIIEALPAAEAIRDSRRESRPPVGRSIRPAVTFSRCSENRRYCRDVVDRQLRPNP